ncbi:hypothetical protein F2Q69_00013634 [Brassica cretica]|uniref:Uncharacterized protein n=1 Tax=Brassica cretica TaxID=69181 RepID=A0A8S9QKD2_BRACR|nr:hypothetical protein F2Q69_00013634 [Brassica cretica]
MNRFSVSSPLLRDDAFEMLRAAGESSRSSLHMECSGKLELRWERQRHTKINSGTARLCCLRVASMPQQTQSSQEQNKMEILRRCRRGSSVSYAPSVVTSLSSANTKKPELDTQTQLLSCLVMR